MKGFLVGTLMAIAAPAVLWLVSCSSVPDFKPSKPVEEASSLDEAIGICGSYQIDGNENGGGHGDPVRVVAMKPWINCFGAVFHRFPTEAADREDLVMFFRALQSRYAGAPTPESEVIDWQSMNFAVSRIVQRLKSEKSAPLKPVYSDQERQMIDREFPTYGMFLAERGAFSPNRKKEARRKAEKKFGIGTEEAADKAAAKTPPRPLTEEQKGYCERYLDYKAKVINLTELQAYKRILEERTFRDSSNSNEAAMKSRIGERVASLELELQGKKSVLERELASLQSRYDWFRNGYCK